MPARPAAIVTCTWCSWSAKHTDDTLLEVATFLKARLIRHCEDKHAECLRPPTPYAVLQVPKP